MGNSFLLGLIVACEVGFWLLLFSGLCARYVLRRKTVSSLLLFCVPLIDVVLLVATVVDLRRGAEATFAHGLAAAYIGFTIAFGGIAVQWADARFAFRFAGGPSPRSAPTHGLDLLIYEAKLWFRCVLAAVITICLVYLAIRIVGEPERTRDVELWLTMPFWTVVLWFIFGPLWSVVFSWTAPASTE
jgi:hypothetical protein